MLDDLTKEIKAQLYDRVRSPLFGAFALSWAVWNYKLILAVLSGMDFDKKMAFIDKMYPTTPDLLISWFIAPLGSAVLFLAAYPVPALMAYEYWADRQRALKVVQQQLEDKTPLTQEEANAIRKASLEEVGALRSELKELGEDNKELKNRLKVLQDENERLDSECATLEELKKSFKLLQDDNGRLVSENAVVEDLKKSLTVLQGHNERLVSENVSSRELTERYKALQEENDRLRLERDRFEEHARKAEEQLTSARAQQSPSAFAAALSNHSPTVAKDLSKIIASPSMPTVETVVAAKKVMLSQRLNASPAAQRIFVSLVHFDGAGALDKLARDSGLSKLEAEDALEILRRDRFVEQTDSGLYGLTAEGRGRAVSMGLPRIFRTGQLEETPETEGAQRERPSGQTLN